VVQVVLMKPVLKAPGSIPLKLRYLGSLSNSAFNFNLRRYREDGEQGTNERRDAFVGVLTELTAAVIRRLPLDASIDQLGRAVQVDLSLTPGCPRLSSVLRLPWVDLA